MMVGIRSNDSQKFGPWQIRDHGIYWQSFEGILELRVELERNIQLQSLFSPQWFQQQLQNKAGELERSIVDLSMSGGIKNLSRMVHLHHELRLRDFLGLNDQLTGAINLQKSYLDDVATKTSTSSDQVREPVVTGPVPNRGRSFSIRAFATSNDKIAGTYNLYLCWNERNKSLECTRVGYAGARRSYDLRIVPADITEINCAVGYGKFFIKSSQGIVPKIRFYVRLSDDADEFVNYLCEKAEGDIDVVYRNSDEIDQLVADLE
ncbi:MAG: hypothetical protein Q9188_004232 [Gyalolechia gomerana]